ncbi:MAG TPA: CvpA family protein [Candidatus Sulfotelmatobacter sp.]
MDHLARVSYMTTAGWTIADWAICAVVLLNVIGAAMQGFFSEALTIAGLIVGYIVAAWKYRSLAGWFESFLKNPWLAEILGFLLIFFAIAVLFGLAAQIARWIMKKTGLSGFDRLLGAVLGLLKGGLMVAVILMGMTVFEPTSRFLQNSQLAPYFLAVGQGAIYLAPTELRQRFYQGLDLLHQAPQKLSNSPASPPK